MTAGCACSASCLPPARSPAAKRGSKRALPLQYLRQALQCLGIGRLFDRAESFPLRPAWRLKDEILDLVAKEAVG
jgi:hypothetical protein